MQISGGYFAGVSMGETTNIALYNAETNSDYACNNVFVFLSAQDQPVGGGVPQHGFVYYPISGQWWTSLLPFNGLPVGDPNRCIR
jgi:hypothetical protein